MAVAMSLHGANRLLERAVPLDAIEGVRKALPLLNEKPLRIKFRGVVIIARLANGRPKIITCWKQKGGEVDDVQNC